MARNIRMLTGAVLYLFVTLHLLNMAFGLHSVDAVDAARTYLTAPWSFGPVFLLLLLSMLLHMGLGLLAFYRRSTLRMSGYDALQLVFGLLIIPLLASHIVGIYAAKSIFGYDPTYRIILSYFWLDAPLEGLRQVIVVVVVWVHGSVGIFTWMRLQNWWDRVSWFAYPFFVAVPVLALLGFVDSGNEIITEAARIVEAPTDSAGNLSEAETAALEEAAAARQAEILANLALASRILWTVLAIYGLLFVLTLGMRAIRLRTQTRNRAVIRYLHGPKVVSETGPSLLEISRLNDVAHANLCRGRGRCGTCRVRVVSGGGELAPPSKIEQETLARLDAAPDVRLACQLHPMVGNLTVERLVPPDISPKDMVLNRHPQAPDAMETADA